MSLTALFAPERRTSPEGARPLTAASLLDILGGQPSATGKRISEEAALRIAVVYACVLIIADGIASLPLSIYRRLANNAGREEATDHPLYSLLHTEPNPWMSSSTLRQTQMGHKLLWGNSFSEIIRDGNGNATGLFPLRPDRMGRPTMSQSGGLLYPYRVPDGSIQALPSNRVLHLRGLSMDGIWGYSPIQLQREGLGLGASLEEYQARLIGNGASPGGVLEAKGKLSPDAATRLAQSWNIAHQGLENSHRVAVLEEGVTWRQVGMPSTDVQLLETRRFTRTEIAGWFRVPPHMIGDVERTTSWGAGIEAQQQGFVTFTLNAHIVNWEQEADRSLLTAPERRTYYVKHNLKGMLRGDTAARQAFYSALQDRGDLSINDVRELEDLNPVEGGDERFVQANMIPLSMAGEQFQKPDPSAQGAQDGQPAGNAGQNSLIPGDTRALDGDRTLSPTELETRSIDRRAHLREVYRPLWEDTARRVVEREAAAIRGQGLDRLEQRSAEGFNTWLEQFYRDDLSGFIVKVATPLLRAYGAATEREVLAELDMESLSESLDPFLESYARDMAKSYTGRSQGQMREILRKALAENLDARAEVEQRLTEWLDTRPEKIAEIETVRAGEAVAHKTYRRAGIRRLTWHTSSARRCDFCAHLNGKTVGIEQDFLSDGDELPGAPGEPPMKIRGNRMHAPVHAACHCYVSAGG